MLTARLELRLPVEADRECFVGLFCDDAFMAFSSGVLDRQAANRRFDRMLLRGQELAFAKQPVIERATGEIVGYSGVDRFEFEGASRLEYGYRLVPPARGQGFATEAGRALLNEAAQTFRGEILAIIDPANHPSKNVACKLGFEYWKQALVDGYLVNPVPVGDPLNLKWRGMPPTASTSRTDGNVTLFDAGRQPHTFLPVVAGRSGRKACHGCFGGFRNQSCRYRARRHMSHRAVEPYAFWRRPLP